MSNKVFQSDNSQGVYVLILEAMNHLCITTIRFKWQLKSGIYLYFGSAKGKTSTSLENRLNRHFRNPKKNFWHIDYLTSPTDTKIISAYFTAKIDMTECLAFREFHSNYPKGEIISDFGSSDCQSNCRGHLIFFSNDNNTFNQVICYFSKNKWKKFNHKD